MREYLMEEWNYPSRWVSETWKIDIEAVLFVFGGPALYVVTHHYID